MFDAEIVSERLQALSDKDTARKRGKHLKPFRGLRGTPVSELARTAAELWRSERPKLPDDAEELHTLFCTAHEDGLVAIALVAAMVPDQPYETLELGERWLDLADDLETADALGRLVLGPSLVAAGEPVLEALTQYARGPKATHRRAALMACMSLLPVPLEGPCASALRERVGQRQVVVVAEPWTPLVLQMLALLFRDSDPHVRKAVGRLGRSLAELDPQAVQDLADGLPGGISKQLRAEWEKGIRRGSRGH
jgi:hypothetical protein